MKKNILFILRTPYQVMVAFRIIESLYNDADVDILICDNVLNVELLINNMKKKIKTINIYNNVELYKQSEFIYNENKLGLFLKLIKFKFTKGKSLEKYIKLNKFYDDIYTSVFNITTDFIIFLNKKKTPRNFFQMHLIEDGFFSYEKINNFQYRKIKLNDPKNIIVKKALMNMLNGSYKKINTINVFSPELMQWQPSFKVNRIPSITKKDSSYLRIMNEIFDYESCTDSYDENVIYFADPSFLNKFAVDDVAILEKISKVVGKENIMVKDHPRNRDNKFEKLGYKTNKNTFIPWEIIALNIDLSEKTLITVTSGAVVNTLIKVNIKPKKLIMLMDCEEFQGEKIHEELSTVKKIVEKYKDDIILPKSLDELNKYL